MSDAVGQKVAKGKQGFRRAGLWLLALGWLLLVFAGLAIVTTPAPPPRALGWALLASAAAIMLLTVNGWVKVFPGLLAYGALGSILSLADGHAMNHPEVPVSWLEGVVMVIFFAVAAALSFTLTKRKLNATDRVALSAFVVCFFWQAAAPRHMWVILGTGFCFLLFAWLYNHFQHSRGHGSRSG